MLHGQIRGLLQKIDMDSKMRKMAELQLSIVGDPKNRKAIENQVSNTLILFVGSAYKYYYMKSFFVSSHAFFLLISSLFLN